MNIYAKNTETFSKKKKTKSVNILASDTEHFLKDFNFLEQFGAPF